MEYTSTLQSPEIFRHWAALSTIAGALERRVWTRMAGSLLYPNTIVLFVASPGIGKSMAINEVYDFWNKTGLFNVAPTGLTKAAFIDQLASKFKHFNHNGFDRGYNAMLLAAPEFGTLLPEYDSRFLNVINDVYDCRESPFEDRTRKDGLITIDRVHVSIIAGTQPKYLGGILPEAAYGMGFTARTLMIYAGEGVVVDLFKAAHRDEELGKELRKDMQQIGGLVGEFEWEDGAKAHVEEWNRDKNKDAPTHPKLIDYNPRRIIHTAKIAMSIAVSRGNDLFVTLSDFKEAREILLHAESLMPEIFKEMTISQDANEIEEIHRFMFSFCQNSGVDGVPEHDLMQHLAQKVPVNKIDFFMKTLENSGMIKCEGLNLPGKRTYRPMPKSVFRKK